VEQVLLVAKKEIDGRRIAAAIICLVLVLTGCASMSTPATPLAVQSASFSTPTAAPAVAQDVTLPSPDATTNVIIQGFSFRPPSITVPLGSAVTWLNNDLEQHTVTAQNGTFNSAAMDNGISFSFQFTKAGTYVYNCQLHPYMVGQVVVTGS
jgi:plastocyanin